MPPLPAIPVYALAVLLVLPLGIWFGKIAADVQPFGWRWDADYWVHFDNPPGDRYPGRQHIVIKACGTGRYRRARPDVVDARAIGVQTPFMISHWGGSEAPWCGLFASDEGLAWVGSFDDQIVRRFVNEAGCDPETAEGRRAVAEVEQRVRFLAAAAFPTTLDEAKVKAALPGFDIYYRLDGRVKRACVQLAWLVLVPLVVRTVWNYRGRRYELIAVRSREAADRLRLTPPVDSAAGSGDERDTRDVSHCCIFYRYT
jgi:hypothetical protein